MRRFMVAVLTSALFAAGCSPTTFIISRDGTAYYFGRESRVLYEKLCSSGELKEILEEASIPEEIKTELYRYTCGDERSKEKVVSAYQFLTPQEKESLQSAFRSHDYTINYVPC